MLGRKKRTPSDVVYLAYSPFIRPKVKGDAPLLVKPQFEEIQKQFIAQILRWCIQKDFVRRDPSSEKLIPNIDKNIASLSYILNFHNFQHLVYQQVLEEFLDMIADNQSRFHTTEVQQLTIALLGLYEPDFIQYHINRVYAAFGSIPLPNAELPWPEIHFRYPFMWVILTIHLVVRNYTETS